MGFFSNLFGSSNNDELNQIIKNNAFLVDVRTPSEFSSGHVKGSINIPLDTIQSNINKFQNKENIVVFCRSGNRSGQAKSILEQFNIKNVHNGGTWQQVNSILNS